MTWDEHTSTAPLGFPLESSQNTFCSIPSRPGPTKACEARLPVLWLPTADRHVRGDLSSAGKLTLFPAVFAFCLSQTTLRREGQGSLWMSPALIPFLLTPDLARVQAAQFAEIAFSHIPRWWPVPSCQFGKDALWWRVLWVLRATRQLGNAQPPRAWGWGRGARACRFRRG